MIKIILCFIIIFLIIIILCSKENYRYENMYQAYEIPFIENAFIASGTRPAVGDYLRTADYDQSPVLVQYENEMINSDSCNICLVNCLNPTSLLYKNKKDSLNKCIGYCKEECKNTDINKLIENVKKESKDQLYHDSDFD